MGFPSGKKFAAWIYSLENSRPESVKREYWGDGQGSLLATQEG
jgi:hypothetical protein